MCSTAVAGFRPISYLEPYSVAGHFYTAVFWPIVLVGEWSWQGTPNISMELSLHLSTVEASAGGCRSSELSLVNSLATSGPASHSHNQIHRWTSDCPAVDAEWGIKDMLEIRLEQNAARIGPRFAVRFERTLRIPDDGGTYPLPPGLGTFPIFRVEDHAEKLPGSWREQGGIFIPIYQREALWLAFHGARWKPNAVTICLGGVNAISGRTNDEVLSATPQNYLVCPQQPWLDGINSGHASVRQFVAMPLGQGATVEAALTGREATGGLQITVYEPKPGIFPDEPPPDDAEMRGGPQAMAAVSPMGLGAGGKLRQKIYPDPFGIKVWDTAQCGRVFVHLLNSAQFREVTGQEPPPVPVDAATYAEHGLPWFDLYDEHKGDVAPPPSLAGAKTVAEQEADSGRLPAEDPLDPRTLPVTKLGNERAAGQAGRSSLSRKPHSSEHE